MRTIKDIFEKFGFKKLSFGVVVGNPVEKQYDRLVRKYKGRIVGVKEQHAKLYDGKYYDVKLYEIISDHYFSNKQNKEREQE